MATMTYKTAEQMRSARSETDWAKVDSAIAAGGAIKAEGDFKGRIVHRGAILGRPKKADAKPAVNIRLAPSTLEKLRAMGRGWQTKLSAKVDEWVKKGVL